MTNTTNFGLNVVQTTDRILADVEALGENAESIDKLCNGTLEGESITTTFGNTRLGDWEIYGQATQNGTPTPSTPVAVKTVTGDNKVIVSGLNLWDEQWEIGGINTSTGQNTSSTSTIRSTNYIPVTPNTNVFYYNGTENMWVFAYDQNKNFLGYATGSSSSISNVSKETPTNCYYIRFFCRSDYGLTYKNDISIYFGTTNLGYIQYTGEPIQLLSLGSIELAKIGNYTDYIYKSGSKWYKHAVCGKYTFTGSESFSTSTSLTTTSRYTCYTTAITPAPMFSQSDGYYNRGMVYKWDALGSSDSFFAYNQNTSMFLAIPVADIPNWSSATTDAEKRTLFKQYLANNTCTIYYILATATDTEITDATLIGQLNNLCKLTTNTGTSTIQVSTSNATPSKLKVYLYNEAQSKLIDRLDSLEARVTILE